jgi:hypothetical protein
LTTDDYERLDPLTPSTAPVTITVTTDPDVGTLSFTAPVLYPIPALQAMYPTQATAGSEGLLLLVSGTTGTYSSGSVVLWNGAPRPTRGVVVPCPLVCPPETLEAEISAADLAAAGTATVQVSNPGPGGGLSPPLTFTILGPRASVPCDSCRRRPPRLYVPPRH